MPGADFVRVDLHVHLYEDNDSNPTPDIAAYISSAQAAGVSVLAITDHNSIRFVDEAVAAGRAAGLLVLPGIEISTHAGHLLALFSPETMDDLRSFATTDNLKLTALSPTEARSSRALPEIVEEISRRGGLAIPAHVDAEEGIQARMRPAELKDLLTSPALAGLEFRTQEALESWFTDDDENTDRRAAWQARQALPELRTRGLARITSSDAHTSAGVGQDRASRTLTRLRLDQPSFEALRLAVQLNPKAR